MINRSRITSFRRLGVVILALSVLAAAPAAAEFPSVTIGSINGESAASGSIKKGVKDTLNVSGSAESIPPAIPLVADAGDSSFVKIGDPANVSGLAFNGEEPYTFNWSHAGSSTRFADPNSQTTTFDTAGLSQGIKTIELQVTDGSGQSSTDTVQLFVYEVTTQTVLDVTETVQPGVPEEFIDRSLGGAVDGQSRQFPFEVDPEAFRLSLELEWEKYVPLDNPILPTGVNDFDLYVDDPSDAEDENISAATGDMPEKMVISTPAPGDWQAIVHAFLNDEDTYHLTAVTESQPADPLPTAAAGGPYTFFEGDPQTLIGSASGGTAPLDVRWDLDGDGIFETEGFEATAALPLGTHFVTFKVTDDVGYEKRETTAVRVFEEGAVLPTAPLVVVHVADTGLNVYHKEFSAATYTDPRVLELTANFTKHPSEYITGYPADTAALNVTLGKGYRPAEDATSWTRANIPLGKLFWIPGTKIVGVTDRSDVAAINAAADTTPILDEDGHGTASASVAVGNTYGFCPTCLLVFTEGLSEEWAYSESWIDIASNSFGSVGNVGFAGVFDPAFPKSAAERGQIALYAAGNGVEGAFVVPEQTYTSESLGPDWVVRVGAAVRSSRKPVVGTGKPVDIASWGSGNIPSAARNSESGQTQHSGTSAATPYSAGVFGNVLANIREVLGDQGVGQRTSVPGAISTGSPLASSPYLKDGVLTRTELVEAVFKTAEHDPSGTVSLLPTTTPNNPGQYLIEGYGLVEPASAIRATNVLRGEAPLPLRPNEDEFFEADEALRDSLWGDWAGGGENSREQQAGAPNPFGSLSLASIPDLNTALSLMTKEFGPFYPNALTDAAAAQASAGSETYWLHHQGGCMDGADPGEFMDRVNSIGDDDYCGGRGTPGATGGQIASFTSTVPTDINLPAGSQVDGIIYLTSDAPADMTLTATLMAGSRQVGRGTAHALSLGLGDIVTGEEGTTPMPIEFVLDQPVVVDEFLTLVFNLETSVSWFFGYEDNHASFFTVNAAESGGGSGGLSATITIPEDGAVFDPTQTPTIPVGGTASFGGPAADPERFFLRRENCANATTDTMYLSTIDGPDAGNRCALTFQALAGTGLFSFAERYPVTQTALPLTLAEGNAAGIIYVDASAGFDSTGVSPDHRIRVELSTTGLGGAVNVIGSQVVSGSYIDVAKLMGGPEPFSFSIPVGPSEAGQILSNLALTVYLENSTTFSYTELDERPSFVDLPLEGAVSGTGVQVSIDDPGFGTPISADVGSNGSWGTTIDATSLSDGPHTIHARAVREDQVSDSSQVTITIQRPQDPDPPKETFVAVTIVPDASNPDSGTWVRAADLSSLGDWSAWSAQLNVASLPWGEYDVYARLVFEGSPVDLDGPISVTRRGGKRT